MDVIWLSLLSAHALDDTNWSKVECGAVAVVPIRPADTSVQVKAVALFQTAV